MLLSLEIQIMDLSLSMQLICTVSLPMFDIVIMPFVLLRTVPDLDMLNQIVEWNEQNHR